MVQLSDGAKTVLRHFRDHGFRELSFELPARLDSLFERPGLWQAVAAELERLGLIQLGEAPGAEVPSRSRAAALTPNGMGFLAICDLG